MKIAVTSDVHITNTNDAGKKFILNFLNHHKVMNADYIIFLGDIFDIMIGPKKQYIKKYHFFFQRILELASQGKKIIYLEGNHDFHLSEVFNSLENENITVVREIFVLRDNDKTISFEHGDELDLENEAYKKWKNIYSSKTMKILVKYFVPHAFIDFIGNKASSNSKKKGSKKFNYEEEKQKYRKHFNNFQKENIDIHVMGHTHIKDEYEVNGKVYLNNGFPQAHQEFLYFDDAQWKWISVDS